MAVQVGFLVLVPILATWGAARSKLLRAISPVVICYAVGMGAANQSWFSVNEKVSLYASFGAVLLAIPLLLMSVNLGAWLRLARATLLAALLAFAAVVLAASGAFLLFHGRIEEPWNIAGMLVGTYTGGSPNMAAIGSALEVKPEQFLMVTVADVVISTLYFLFLVSFAPRVFARFLPPFLRTARPGVVDERPSEQARVRTSIPALGLALLIAAAGGASYLLAPGSMGEILMVLAVTTLAIVASLFRRIRALPGSYETGQFVLLVFCVGIGSLADFGKLLTMSPYILLYATVSLGGAVVLHLLFCRAFRIDRDTWMITSAAAIFSPAFVGVIADRLKNREVVFSGVTAGLVGFAVGNYLGIAIALLLEKLQAHVL